METPLFRGVRCSDHKLVYGNYVKSDKSWSGKQYHRDWIVGNAQTNGGWFALMGKWAVVDGTVQQYSGKRDKNDVPIFGGDILLILEIDQRLVVQYNDDKACFVVARSSGWGMITEIPLHALTNDIVVIGNIYEDKEYIKALEKKNAEHRRMWRKVK